jgi:hypothetical protein
LFDETLLHPHALVYCDETVAEANCFQDEVNKHNLLFNDYSNRGSNWLPEQNTMESQDGEVQNLDKTKQYLVTSPKFSCQLSQPIVSCVFHMDSSTKSPATYGAHLSLVDEKCSWDSISVLFVEPQDVGTVSDIENMFGIQFREIPFDVPEISWTPKASWKKGSVRRGRWWNL